MRTTILALALVASPAVAQQCPSYVGQTVSPTTIEAALARYSTLPHRLKLANMF